MTLLTRKRVLVLVGLCILLAALTYVGLQVWYYNRASIEEHDPTYSDHDLACLRGEWTDEKKPPLDPMLESS